MKPERDDVITGILVGISIIIGIYILSFVLQMLVTYG